MSSTHVSKGGRRWRYYVSRAALTGRRQDAGSIVRVPASEIENRITRAVGTHLAVQAAIAIDDHHINHSVNAEGFTKKAFANEMERLLADDRIRVETIGPPSRRYNQAARICRRGCAGKYSSAGEVRWRSLVSGCQP